MARRRTETVLVTRWDGVAARRGPDELIVEEPMAIQLDGVLVATTMRTPGHDYELAVGYCLTEGLLGGAPVESVRYCATGSATETDFNVVTVETGGRAPAPTPRLTPTTSSCGICGSASSTSCSSGWTRCPRHGPGSRPSRSPTWPAPPWPASPVRLDGCGARAVAFDARARPSWPGRTSAVTARSTR